MMYYEKRKTFSFGSILIIFFLIVIVGILVNIINKIDSNLNKDIVVTEETGTDTVLNNFTVDSLIENSMYSVVGISKLSQNNTAIFAQDSELKLGIGSGIILSSDGYILTNQIIAGEKENTCYVTLKNGEIYPAKVIWSNKNLDLAIIKISAQNLLAFSYGDSDKCTLGENVYMISNPYGVSLRQNFFEGNISQVNNTVKIVNDDSEDYAEDIMKINTDILFSQTGSPVLNRNGELIGISSNKLNAIIPINRIKPIIERLKNNGEFKEAKLGIYGYDNEFLSYLKLDLKIKIGVYIEKIEEDSPVYNQVLSGDILTKIDNQELSTMQELSCYLYTKNPGDKVKLSLIRGTSQIEIDTNLK